MSDKFNLNLLIEFSILLKSINAALEKYTATKPSSSPFTKFAILPKNIPTGATHETTSNKISLSKSFFLQNSKKAFNYSKSQQKANRK